MKKKRNTEESQGNSPEVSKQEIEMNIELKKLIEVNETRLSAMRKIINELSRKKHK